MKISKKENVKLNTLSNYENLLEQALETKYISDQGISKLCQIGMPILVNGTLINISSMLIIQVL